MINIRRLFSLYVLVIIGTYFVLHFEMEQKIDKYLDDKTKLFGQLYLVHYHNYYQKSQMMYDLFVNNEQVKNIYKRLQNCNEEQKNLLREDLYKLLAQKYQKIQYTQVKQFHFHLPNNESFLRLHQPNKYGDNLSNIRETVSNVNKHHKPISGFEMGRIYSGLRFVYPISDGLEHLGSVEISFDISIFSLEFMDYFNVLTNFYFNSDVLAKKTWKEFIEQNYTPSPIKGYCLEKKNSLIFQNNIHKLYLENVNFQLV